MSSAFFDRVRAALQPRYRLDDTVGAGGMAIVFRAFDTSLERAVAVKVLRPELATAVNAERFTREARRLAGLSDPHLVSVHDVGEVDGILYYVMDLVEAGTLRERLVRGPLDPPAALRVADGLLRGLAVVHAAGLVHRDVKPENVFLKGGEPLLTDFGIAKSLETTAGEALTREGGPPGTPAYMPPEQAQGAVVGPTADLYAAGMILFECLTGRRWPAGFRPTAVEWGGVPARLRPALAKALQLRPDRRWQDAESFRLALSAARPPWFAGRVARAALAAAGVIALAGLGWVLWGAAAGDGGNIRSMAMRPCTDVELDEGLRGVGYALAEQVKDRLGERGLRVASLSAVARLSPASDPREIGARLGVDAVIGCRVRPDGDRVRVTVELADARSAEVVWDHEFIEPLSGLLELPEGFANAIAGAIRHETRAAPAPPTGPRDLDQRALTAWLAGSRAWRQRTEDPTGQSLRRAERNFLVALEREPSFGHALASLAEVYVTLSGRGLAAPDEAFPRALAFADSAIAVGWDPAAAYAARGEAFRAYFWDRWDEAETAFRASISRDSFHVPAHLWYALWLSAEAEHDRAFARAEWAAELDPSSPDVSTGLGVVLYLAGRSPDAVDRLAWTVDHNPAAWEARLWLAAALLADGRGGEARAQLDEVRPRVPPHVYPILAAGYAAVGAEAEARRLLSEAVRGASPFWAAVAYTNLDEPGRALELLETAWSAKDEFLSYVGVLPLLASFRDTPEYRRFVERREMPWFTGR